MHEALDKGSPNVATCRPSITVGGIPMIGISEGHLGVGRLSLADLSLSRGMKRLAIRPRGSAKDASKLLGGKHSVVAPTAESQDMWAKKGALVHLSLIHI